MTERVIQLPPTSRLSRNVLGDCRWKIKTFVERDAYVTYDFIGGYDNPSGDVINDRHVYVMNRAMMARSSRAAWQRSMDRPIPELAEIAPDLDLVDASDAEVRKGHEALSELARPLLARKGLSDVSVSKVLYLLRPRFVAISDKYVRRCLGIPEPDTSNTDDSLSTLMAVQRGIRGLAKRNKEALDELLEYANALPPIPITQGELADMMIPVKLSKIRILDIVLWSDVAIHDEGHVNWSRWYANEVGAVSASDRRVDS
jgi:hypothetical protein